MPPMIGLCDSRPMTTGMEISAPSTMEIATSFTVTQIPLRMRGPYLATFSGS